MNIRQVIYSSANSDLSGRATANAGSDQNEEQVEDFSPLDGTGSSTTGGTVDVYLWEIISGFGLVIDTPNASTSTLSGTTIVGDNIIKLTITDTNGNTDYDYVTITVDPIPALVISSSIPDSNGQGTLNITNGQAGEVVPLGFVLNYGQAPHAITFSGGIMVGRLDYIKTTTTGSITLDGSGNGSSNYDATGKGFVVEVSITGRSSGYPVPTVDFTTIYIY